MAHLIAAVSHADSVVFLVGPACVPAVLLLRRGGFFDRALLFAGDELVVGVLLCDDSV